MREILSDIEKEFKKPQAFYRMTPGTMQALHISLEFYMITLLEDSYLAALHAGRVTLTKSDIRLTRRLRHEIRQVHMIDVHICIWLVADPVCGARAGCPPWIRQCWYTVFDSHAS